MLFAVAVPQKEEFTTIRGPARYQIGVVSPSSTSDFCRLRSRGLVFQPIWDCLPSRCEILRLVAKAKW